MTVDEGTVDKRPEVALVEDERNVRELYLDVLGARGLNVVPLDSVAAAEAYLARRVPDLLVLDVRLGDGDGLVLLDRLRGRGFRTPVIVMTAFGTVERAVQALRAGAADFLVKPFGNERLISSVEAALESGRRLVELELAAPTLGPGTEAVRALVGADGGLRDVVALLPRVAASDATVLVRGESGTGKELVARAIHAASSRLDGPFISVNCAALPSSLLESELFGFERGVFTGAHARHKGLIEAAEGGTLFLDEIGDMSLEAQSRLLRVLQERELTRIGGREPVKVDIRVIAATHRDLDAMAASGQFRSDLLYRLAVIPILLPPLRERTRDIPGLIHHFLEKHAAKKGLRPPRPDAETLRRAESWPWPGNVRELENFVERSVVLGRFDPESLRMPQPAKAAPASTPVEVHEPTAPAEAHAPVLPLREAVARAERAAVIAALQAAKGQKTVAARLLGVSYKTLFNKIHEHDIREELHIG
ncbi:sigma-54 dependent transcriptional regulator [Vitiosangium sp. GDMCC 1.1324]|uniref:sigma-54-dependent transcriptional regulator n=1 Tax=Vitiosangium sp. (strain GDMCC 1.1324) TaxID=2138576 RepID=UPI000D37E730|nr:sigma-54 dependent transcriptional regulator [Vitiosangium sp. GDMCC 1.1324]PTL75238.1 two-component system response regulator [Vitiosangium sp. GDMCC 1.1324]